MRIMIFVVLMLMLQSCMVYNTNQGVQNGWRDPNLPSLEKGKTTQSDVFEMLGPPSQVIALEQHTVFYYLLEKKSGQALWLGIYNQRKEKIEYDRAMFFFNQKDVLEDYSFSQEKFKYKARKKQE